MYIELKEDGVNGTARIGRVAFSKTGKTIYYKDKKFRPFKGYKANYFDEDTGEEYWITGCKRKGNDRLYSVTIEIDEDVAEEYWTNIRCMPQCRNKTVIRCEGKHKR